MVWQAWMSNKEALGKEERNRAYKNCGYQGGEGRGEDGLPGCSIAISGEEISSVEC